MLATLPVSLSPLANELEQALLIVDRIKARSIVSAYAKEHTPFELVENLFAPVMEHIGQGWETGETALSQVFMSGQICAELAEGLEWDEAEKPWPQKHMAICILEDYHMLGKQMVYSALRASGYDLLDYGRMDVEPLVEKVREDGVQLLLISTLMLRSALRVKLLRDRMDAEGMNVRIIVGGAPFRFDPELWKEIKADAMALNTAEALAVVRRMS
jgi:methanogenic corrinoid protein MtbC1